MSMRMQGLLLVFFILVSVLITNTKSKEIASSEEFKKEDVVSLLKPQGNLSYERAALLSQAVQIERVPIRKWEILDPSVSAQAVLIQSLDEHFPFLRYQTNESWPMASISKLLTALLVMEEIGTNKKIPISEEAVKTLGANGGLKAGELYSAQDLLKIMLITSSNDAAAAFEEYMGGKEFMVKMLNEKAASLGMSQTIVHDASGLSDLNESSADDLLKLIRYIVEEQPELFSWTRLKNFLVQPINDVQSRTENSINGFTNAENFLGGKTGTSPQAGENLVGVFSIHNHRLAFILLGSKNREKDGKTLLRWVEEAYQW